MKNIIGRNKEQAILQKAMQSKASEFIALYGRRRVGKTFLVREVFENKFTFYLTGVLGSNTKQQLTNFHRALNKYNKKSGTPIPQNWFDAFAQLEQLIKVSKEKKKVIFLDELPWLDTPKSNFIEALDYFWNSYASARKDVLLIVCGSAASWMITKLIHNRGGLHNRVSHRIRMEPFTLQECEEFFKNKNAVFNRYQLIQLYMVMGGIPFYLNHVNPQLSAVQNINQLCFQSDGLLVGEFDELYYSLFKNAEKHVAIVEVLSKKSKGLNRAAIIKQANLSNAGSATRILKELEESSFIRKYPSYGKKERDMLYQLTDFYSLFYFKFIHSNHILDENSWINGLDTAEQKAWSGYAFEQVCLWHIHQIKQALSIGGIQTVTSSWKDPGSEKGAQIDLVIDRRDQVINICEIKFSIQDFTINKKYFDELRNKIAVFKEQTGTRKAVYLTFITTFGLKKNEYSTSLVQNELTMDALFSIGSY